MKKLANYSALANVVISYPLIYFSACGILCLFRKTCYILLSLKITANSYEYLLNGFNTKSYCSHTTPMRTHFSCEELVSHYTSEEKKSQISFNIIQ